jgi:hypothetical protein
MTQVPELLLRSIESFYTNVTEPLDPYVALALTNLSTKMAEMAYTMGYQDGQKGGKSDCELCGDRGGCVGSVFEQMGDRS